MKFKVLLERLEGSKNSNWKSKKNSYSWKWTQNKKNKKAGKDGVGYRAYHMRIQADKGKASSHKCRKCGSQADDWAIVGKGSSIPLCRSCHSKTHKRGQNFTKNK